jgi:hypothetical protein
MSVDEISTDLAGQNELTGERPSGSETTPTNSFEPELTAGAAVEPVVTAAVATGPHGEAASVQNNEGIQVLSERVEELAGLLEEANVLSRERERILRALTFNFRIIEQVYKEATRGSMRSSGCGAL